LSATDLEQVLIGLPPLIDERSRVLVLGSFPSKLSLHKREYYGNPQNHFWLIMEALFGIDRQAPYARRTDALLEERIAVWDVIAECSREGSGDDAIMDATPNTLSRLLHEFPDIRSIAFNGGTALRTARLFAPDLFEADDLACERLPSTSPRNARLPLTAKVETWAILKTWLGR
jgi:TDG/mug DNA glycosylase family protein